MAREVVFWILVGGLAFGFALAVQMRVMIALVLRRALLAWRDEFSDKVKANTAVVWAAETEALPDEARPWLQEAASHLRAEYAPALSHLRTARRASVVLPVLLFGVLALGRFALGVI